MTWRTENDRLMLFKSRCRETGKPFLLPVLVLCVFQIRATEDSEYESLFARAVKKIKFGKWKARMLDEHNRFRITTKPPAANMREIKWNRSLQKMAQFWTDKCVFKHSPRSYRKVPGKFKYLGENLFMGGGSLENVVNAWAKEVTDYNYASHKCRPNKACGHYTQVVWAKTTDIGCAFTDCSKDRDKNKFIVSCLYGPGGNYKGVRPYEKGTRCSKCPDGTSCDDKALCVSSKANREMDEFDLINDIFGEIY